jgi:hypothetical protein
MGEMLRSAHGWLGPQELEAAALQGVFRWVSLHIVHILHTFSQLVQGCGQRPIGSARRQTDEEKASVSNDLRRQIEIGRMHRLSYKYRPQRYARSQRQKVAGTAGLQCTMFRNAFLTGRAALWMIAHR